MRYVLMFLNMCINKIIIAFSHTKKNRARVSFVSSILGATETEIETNVGLNLSRQIFDIISRKHSSRNNRGKSRSEDRAMFLICFWIAEIKSDISERTESEKVQNAWSNH